MRKTRKNKYNAKKTTISGIKFDSMKEGRRFLELNTMEKAGLISGIEIQPEFVLQDKFTHEGKTIREIKYRADFRYINQDGFDTVEDVKGKKTALYQIKKKLFLKRYPELNFIET